MRLLRAVIFTLALAVGLTLAPAAEARHVFVSYVDAGRPSTFAKADVMAAIQRVLREWEAHVSISSFVFHWQGEIPLAGAPENYDNVVIRWGGVCPGLLGASCRASSMRTPTSSRPSSRATGRGWRRLIPGLPSPTATAGRGWRPPRS